MFFHGEQEFRMRRVSTDYWKSINRKQRPTREKAQSPVRYFLLIHLRKISQLKVEVTLSGVPL